jgi:ABC-type multidrug transport system ATPase subunit
MKINLENTGKKYNRDWIFRGITTQISLNDSIVISGSNGSGKSTFLKMISGFETPTEGEISYSENKEIPVEKIYKKVAYTSPYIGVFEEYTIEELLKFYSTLKPLKNNIKFDQFIETIELTHTKNKAIKHFSSGMKQRVKLGLSILSDSPILLLDEPTSNLDKNAILWYQNLVQKNLNNRIVIIASNNQKEESFFCTKSIDIEEFK